MHCTPLYKIYMYLGLSISFIDIKVEGKEEKVGNWVYLHFSSQITQGWEVFA